MEEEEEFEFITAKLYMARFWWIASTDKTTHRTKFLILMSVAVSGQLCLSTGVKADNGWPIVIPLVTADASFTTIPWFGRVGSS